MPRWLTQARAFGRDDAGAPEPFELTCSCGRIVRGVRENRFQQVECPDCGERLFVLPRNVYPLPTPAARPKRKRRSAPAAVRVEADPSMPEAPETERARGDVSPHPDRAIDLAERGRAWWRPTRLRLVILAMVLVMAGTAAWLHHLRGLEHAELVLQRAGEQGLAALQRGEFHAAEQQLRSAVAALDRLGREDARAGMLRQSLREATSLNGLADGSLNDLLAEAERALEQGEKLWNEQFRRSWQGRWIVMEAAWTPPDATVEPAATWDVPLMLGGRQAVLRVPRSLIEGLSNDQGLQPVVFAGQLEGCRRSGSGPQAGYIVRLRTDTAFLWSGFDTYQALGFDLSDPQREQQVRAVLAAQAHTTP